MAMKCVWQLYKFFDFWKCVNSFSYLFTKSLKKSGPKWVQNNGLCHPVDGKNYKKKKVQSGRSLWWKLSQLRSKMTYQFHGLASHGGLNLQIKQHNSRIFIYKRHTIKGGNFIRCFCHSVNLSVIVNTKIRIKSKKKCKSPK